MYCDFTNKRYHWQYVIDAFTSQAFSGNPAAVVMDKERYQMKKNTPIEWMKNIAKENNISETAFLTPLIDTKSHIQDSIESIEDFKRLLCACAGNDHHKLIQKAIYEIRWYM